MLRSAKGMFRQGWFLHFFRFIFFSCGFDAFCFPTISFDQPFTLVATVAVIVTVVRVFFFHTGDVPLLLRGSVLYCVVFRSATTDISRSNSSTVVPGVSLTCFCVLLRFLFSLVRYGGVVGGYICRAKWHRAALCSLACMLRASLRLLVARNG